MYEIIDLASQFVVVHCGADGCDQDFGMSRRFYDETRRTGRNWHCPSGHQRVWKGETTEQQLKQSKAREQHLADQLQAAVADAEETRVRLIRDRHRFSKGVCPCCNRSFPALTRHMATQHPDYDPSDLTASTPAYECSCGRSFASPHGLRIHQGKSRVGGWALPETSKWRAHLTVVSMA